MRVAMLALAALIPACAQEIKMPVSLDALEAKAENSVSVTVDKAMLRIAGKFLKDEGDEAEARQIIANLDGVYVRSFEFDHEGEYSRADVDAVRQQLRDPAWSRVVGVRSKRRDGDVDIYFKDGANGQLGGMVLICAEPRELTIIHIIGNIDLDKLAQLDGEFSIPRLDTSHARRESR